LILIIFFSGGPAIANGKLVGVANFVVGGCGSFFPDGYAKVSYFKNWISQTVKKHDTELPEISFL
jgi:secreted trypsin-like serine protease